MVKDQGDNNMDGYNVPMMCMRITTILFQRKQGRRI